MIRKIKEFLFGNATADSYKRAELLQPIDPDVAAERLRVEVRGSEDGHANVPAHDASNASAAEDDIALYFNEEAREAAKQTNNRINLFNKRIRECGVDKELADIRNTAPHLKTVLPPTVTEHSGLLRELKKDENELREELRRFRGENKLARSAVHPGFGMKFFLFFIIAAILLLEAVMNGYFFGQGSEFGWFGGIQQAIIFAALNIFVALLFGRKIIPQIIHVNGARKAMGFAGLGLFVLLLPIYNFAVGHFRDSVASSLTDSGSGFVAVGTELVDKMLPNPFVLQNFESYILAGFGIFFGVVAALDGWNLDDPYPGYGKLTRRFENAQKFYFSDKGRLMAELERLRDIANNKLNKLEDHLISRRKDLGDIATMANNQYQSYHSHFHDLESKCNNLLSRYWDANQRSRSELKPQHFGNPIQLTKEILDNVAIPTDSEAIRETLAGLEDGLSSLNTAKKQVNTIYGNTINDLSRELETIES